MCFIYSSITCKYLLWKPYFHFHRCIGANIAADPVLLSSLDLRVREIIAVFCRHLEEQQEQGQHVCLQYFL